MKEFINRLSVVLSLLSEKTDDKNFQDFLKREALQVLSLNRNFVQEDLKKTFLVELKDYLIYLVGVLDHGRICGYVSNMNASLVVDSLLKKISEVENLILNSAKENFYDFTQILNQTNFDRQLAKQSQKNNSQILNSFTQISQKEIPENVALEISTTKNLASFEDLKSDAVQKNISTKTENVSNFIEPQKEPQNELQKEPLVYTIFSQSEGAKIEERRSKILNLLKSGGGNLKDLLNHFPGLNEKMLQRDLLELIRERKVVMLGKKRWAKYYLK